MRPPSSASGQSPPEVTDLTGLAKSGKLNGAIGRYDLVFRLINHVHSDVNTDRHRITVLEGKIGVGKTAIVEQLAIELARAKTPMWPDGPVLSDFRVWSVDVPALATGVPCYSDFLDRVTSLFELGARAAGRLVLVFEGFDVPLMFRRFIDDPTEYRPSIDTIMGDIGLRQLARHYRCHCIITSSSRLFERGSFERVSGGLAWHDEIRLDEPDTGLSKGILYCKSNRLRKELGVHVESDAIQAAVEFCELFVHVPARPGRAVSLLVDATRRLAENLDHRVSLGQRLKAAPSSAALLEQLQMEIALIQQLRDYRKCIARLQNEKDLKGLPLASDAEDKLKDQERQCDVLAAQLHGITQPLLEWEVKRKHIAEEVALRLGVDASRITNDWRAIAIRARRQLDECFPGEQLLPNAIAGSIGHFLEERLAAIRHDEELYDKKLEEALSDRVPDDQDSRFDLQRVRSKRGLCESLSEGGRAFLFIGFHEEKIVGVARIIADALVADTSAVVRLKEDAIKRESLRLALKDRSGPVIALLENVDPSDEQKLGWVQAITDDHGLGLERDDFSKLFLILTADVPELASSTSLAEVSRDGGTRQSAAQTLRIQECDAAKQALSGRLSSTFLNHFQVFLRR